MKALKVIGVILLVLIAIYLVAAAVAPSALKVERSVVIEAPAAAVYPHVACFRNWESWNPWDAMDSTNTNTFSDQDCGVGAWYTWEGEQTGSGRQEIVEARENEYIKCALVFGADTSVHTSEWILEETDEGTQVTWTFSSVEVPFLKRPMNLMGEYFLSRSYESGLAALKEVVESAPADEISEYEVTVIDLPESDYLLISGELHPRDIPTFYSENFGKIMAHMTANGAEMNGYPTGVYFSWTDTLTKMAAAIPVNGPVAGTEVIEARSLGGGKALQIEYYGPYEGVGAAHYAIERYSNENGVDLEGFAMEIYVTDPGEEPDTNKWLTRIIYPLAAAE